MWRKNSLAVAMALALVGVAVASEDMENLAPVASAPSAARQATPAPPDKSADAAMNQKALGNMSQAEYLRYRIQLKNQTELNKAQIEVLESQRKLEALQGQVKGGAPSPVTESATTTTSAPPSQKEIARDMLKKLSVYGIFSDNGEYSAEIRSGRGIIPVRVGDSLPGSYVVVAITPTDVRVRDADGNESSIPLPHEQQRTTSGLPMLFPPPSIGAQ